MRKGAWAITKDHIDSNAVGTFGPSQSEFWNDKNTAQDVIDHPEGVKFKLYDDDGELYYEGVMVEGEGDEEDCFGPLDDFGTPNAGAVRLDYYNSTDRKWETM